MSFTFLALFLTTTAFSQTLPDWRHIGSYAIDDSLASAGTGPIDRTWYSTDGSQLFARTHSGRVFVTSDFETWAPVAEAPADPVSALAPVSSILPEPAATTRSRLGSSARLYAFGRHAWRSEDGGSHWSNLTAYKESSLVGGHIRDLAVSPRDEEEIAVATVQGLWRSLDGGLSWTGLNQSLPNLPVVRILDLGTGSQGLRIALATGDTSPGMREAIWWPGEKSAWRPFPSSTLAKELSLRQKLSQILNLQITSARASGEYLYAGSADGHIWSSSDQSRTWQQYLLPEQAPVEALFVDPKDPRFALAAIGGRLNQSALKATHVLRTINGGLSWYDLTSDLPDTPAHGLTADRASGAVYLATERGVFFTLADLNGAGPPTAWTPITSNLPSAAATDVKLDRGANQLYIAIDGYGIYVATAPHRANDLRVVSAADFSDRPAAPGSLLTVLGGRLQSARVGTLNFPVLPSTETDSQIQVPFEARGSTLSLALEANTGRFAVGVPLLSVSPGIFVDRDGTPFLVDAESGVLLDALTPAHAHGRIQILATGLGRVRPDWPTGVPAPLDRLPKVIAPVRAWLDRTPIEILSATLAPGYVGFYLIEVQLPAIVNSGPAELHLEADGQSSNRVRLYIDQ